MMNPCEIPPMRVVQGDTPNLVESRDSGVEKRRVVVSSGYEYPGYDVENSSITTIDCPTSMVNLGSIRLSKCNRFYNLISNWNKMSNEEKISCFMTKVYHIYLADIPKEEWSDAVNTEIYKITMETGRTLVDVRMVNSHQSVAQYSLIFNPVDHELLPSPFKEAYVSYGKDTGFLYGFCQN